MTTAETKQPSRRAPRALTAAAGLAAALPVLVSTVRAVSERWVPFGDQGTIAVRSLDVLSSHMPLLGQYSDSSQLTGRVTYSPGPLLYWLLALPARLGTGEAIAIAIGLVNAAAVVACVALARRRGGVALMLVTAVALAVMCRSFPSETFHDPWNPSAVVLPFTLLIFVCWSVAAGEGRQLPLASLLASFVVQCHLAYVAPAVLLLAIGAGGLVRARALPSRRWLLATAAVALACWSAPIAEQLTHTPGNAALLARVGTASTPKLGAASGLRAVVRAVGVPPWWLVRPGDEFHAARDVRMNMGGLAAAGGGAVVLTLALVGVAGVRRRRMDVAAAAAIGLALCVAIGAVAAATPTRPVLAASLGYTLWWGSPAGLFAWLAAGWGAVTLWARRPAVAARPATAAGLAAALAAGVAVAVSQGSDRHAGLYGPIRSVTSSLERTVPAGRTVWLDGAGARTVALRPAITYQLRRRGSRVLGAGAGLRLGRWYVLDRRHWDDAVYVGEGRRPPPGRGVAVASATIDGGPVTVSVLRAR